MSCALIFVLRVDTSSLKAGMCSHIDSSPDSDNNPLDTQAINAEGERKGKSTWLGVILSAWSLVSAV